MGFCASCIQRFTGTAPKSGAGHHGQCEACGRATFIMTGSISFTPEEKVTAADLEEQRKRLKEAFDKLDPETKAHVKEALKKAFDELKDPNSQAHKGLVAGVQAIQALGTVARFKRQQEEK